MIFQLCWLAKQLELELELELQKASTEMHTGIRYDLKYLTTVVIGAYTFPFSDWSHVGPLHFSIDRLIQISIPNTLAGLCPCNLVYRWPIISSQRGGVNTFASLITTKKS